MPLIPAATLLTEHVDTAVIRASIAAPLVKRFPAKRPLHAAGKTILANPEQSIASSAASHGRCRTSLGKLEALACPAPDIVTAIVKGRRSFHA
jgi:hypothetical protein